MDMKKNIDFRDEWIEKNKVINAMIDNNFDENEWINKLLVIVTGKQIGRAHV